VPLNDSSRGLPAVPSKLYAGKSWLDHVRGCACCLTRTEGVSPCYIKAKGCQDLSTLNQCCWQDMPDQKNKACFLFLHPKNDSVCLRALGLGQSALNCQPVLLAGHATPGRALTECMLRKTFLH
jgi:hypothetical protein